MAELKASTKGYYANPITKEGGFLSSPEYTNFDFYLIYLSPQLIIAAVHQEALKQEYSIQEEEQLLQEVNQRLLEENSMVFILYMKSGNSNVGVNIGPARQNIRLLPITGPAIPPSKYEPLFDKVFDMRTDNGTRWGYLFFPLSSGCSNGQLVNAVDPNRLASVTVEMARAHVEYSIMSPGPSWTFNLVPVDLGLEEALQIPERQHLSPEQKLTLNDWSSIATIAGTALEVLRFIIRRRL